MWQGLGQVGIPLRGLLLAQASHSTAVCPGGLPLGPAQHLTFISDPLPCSPSVRVSMLPLTSHRCPSHSCPASLLVRTSAVPALVPASQEHRGQLQAGAEEGRSRPLPPFSHPTQCHLASRPHGSVPGDPRPLAQH